MKKRCFLSFVTLLLIIGTTKTIAQKQVSVSDEGTIVCPNTTVQLLAPQGALSYEWKPAQQLSGSDIYNPLTTIAEKTTFEVTYLYDTGINLVRNGDFERGNTGFVSYYTYKTPNGSRTLYPEGCYTVWRNAREVHDRWSTVRDHTTGSGNYLIANGHTTPNFIVWEQSISVEPNQDYIFQAYAVNFLDNPAQLQFSIEGVQLGNIFTLQGTNTWQHFYVVWNSGSYNGNITIRLLNQRTEPGGNDFGVDDISFQKLDRKTETVTIDVYNTDLKITETACESYTWHGTTYTESGTYVYNYTNEQGCASIETLNLTINKGTQTTLTETACESYTWHGTTYTESGTYVYNYTNEQGCASSETLNLTINKGTQTTLTETACESYTWHGTTYTESGTYVYNYTNEQGCASSETLNLTINKGTQTTLTETACESYTWHGTTYTESGTYVYNYTNEQGCASSETLNLTIVVLDYKIDYELLDCKERIYRFVPKNIGTTQNDKLEWKFPDGTIISDFIAEHKLQEGNQTVLLTVTSETGCSKDFMLELTVLAYFDDYEIEVDPTALITPGKSTVRLYTVYRPGVDYDWDFGDGSHGFDSDVVHTYNVSGEDYYDVVLTVTDTENCVEERSIRILVDKSVDVPNTFTPNGDGFNDLFLDGWHIKIFDRKGFLIYEGDKGWDGTYMNKMVPDDTYFYIMNYTENGQNITKKGFITVIK